MFLKLHFLTVAIIEKPMDFFIALLFILLLYFNTLPSDSSGCMCSIICEYHICKWSFYFILSNIISLISFSCLIVLPVQWIEMVCSWSKRKSLKHFTIKYDVCWRFSVDTVIHLWVYYEWMLNFIKMLFCINWDIHIIVLHCYFLFF